MKENDFHIVGEINNDLLCSICKKIMIKACNAACGCIYCLECITNYLNGINKYCPGISNECKDQLINIDRDIQIDRSINIRISRTIVKCSYNGCDFTDELKEMKNHLSICNLRPTSCPYFNIGCRDEKISPDKINEHIQTENYSHTKLMTDCIDNMKNEMDLMKNEFAQLKQENQLLKERMEILQLDGDRKQVK